MKNLAQECLFHSANFGRGRTTNGATFSVFEIGKPQDRDRLAIATIHEPSFTGSRIMKPGIEKCRQISELAQLKRALATVHEKNRIETIQRKIVILRQILSDSEAVFNAFNETNRTRNRVDPLEVMAEMDAVPKITFRRGFFWNR